MEELSRLKVSNLYPKGYHFHTFENSYVASMIGKNQFRRISTPSTPVTPTANSNISFYVQPPMGFLSSTPYLHYTATYTLTGWLRGANITVASARDYVGPRVFALNSLISSCNVAFGEYKYTTLVSEYVNLYSKFLSSEKAYRISQVSRPDNMNIYAVGALDNVLKVGSDITERGGTDSRGLGNRYNVTALADNGAGVLTITFDYYEMLMASPFQFLEDEPIPYHNMPLMRVDFVLADIVNNFWSVGGQPRGAGGAGEMAFGIANQSINIEFDSWGEDSRISIPRSLIYHNIAPSHYTQEIQAGLAIGATSGSLQSSAFSFNSVPNMFCIYYQTNSGVVGTGNYTQVTRDNIGLSQFLSLNGISINVNSSTGIFNDLNPYDLYLISQRNGYNQKSSSFRGSLLVGAVAGTDTAIAAPTLNGNGCAFYFRPADLGVDNFYANANTYFTLDFSSTIVNRSGYTIPALGITMHLFLMYEDLAFDVDGVWNRQIVQIPLEQLTNPSNKIEYQQGTPWNNVVSGGSFWGDALGALKKVASKVLPGLSRTARETFTPIIKGVAPGWTHKLIDEGNKLASKAGYGRKKRGSALLKLGGRRRRGGKAIPRDVLELLD